MSRAAAGAILLAIPVFVQAQTYAPPASGDYGGTGPYSVFISSFTNPVYPTASGLTLTVSVYHPNSTINASLPTIFLAHGYTTPIGNTANYDTLLRNLASRGYNVVFSPYEGGLSPDIARRFDELTTGFDAAASMYGLNTAQVGFVGHSYGGGFMPAVVQHEMMGVTDQSGTPGHQWGGTSAFMFSMAPSYAYGGLPVTQSISFPPDINVVEQVFFDDRTVVDPRLAIDVFYNITVPASQKEFLTVYGDNHGTPAQVADHFLPNSGITSTSLQAWGVFRHIDALADYTFTGNAAAQEIALGNGAPAETYMGLWSDGVPVVPLSATDFPSPSAYYAGPYTVNWNDLANPRRAIPMSIQITAWRSVRTHAGIGDLAISLDPAATGNGLTGPTVETRNGGVQNIEVDFDQAVSIVNAGALKITGQTTASGVLSAPVDYSSLASLNLPNPQTLQVAVPAGALPDESCYTINLAGVVQTELGAVLSGDTDCSIRSLVGDVTGNGSLNLGDALYVSSYVGQAVDATTAAFDVDLDGTISLADVLAVKQLVASPPREASCP